MSAVELPVSPTSSPYVGRTGEIGELIKVLENAARGRGGLAFITGEPGIGRTSIALRMSDHAIARGFAARWSTSWPQATARSYWPWSQLIEAHMADAGETVIPRLVAAIRPALATIAPGLAISMNVSAPDPAPGDQLALFQSVTRFWAIAATRQRPLLLVIDDLQWADPASVRLLAHLSTVLRHAPVALAATIRAGEPIDETLAEALAELDRSAPMLVAMRELPRSALVDLVRANGLTPYPEMVDLLARRSGGNPSYATGLLQALEKSANRTDSVTALADVLPGHLEQAVRQRLSLLDPAARQLMKAASVIGPAGDIGVLGAIAGLDLDMTGDLLDRCVGCGLMARDRTGSWQFVHTVVGDVSYRLLPLLLRRQSHQRALEVLEARHAPVVQLARHARYAVEPGEAEPRGAARAVALLAEAGKNHLAGHDYARAADCFEGAIALGEAGTGEQAHRLLMLADSYRGRGHVARAEGAYHAARAAAGVDAELLGAATAGITDPAVGLSLPRHAAEGGTVDVLQQALAALGDAETPPRVKLMARLGYEFYFLGDRKRGRSVTGNALAMARRVGDPVAYVAAAMAHHHVQVIGRISLGAALAESAEMLQVALSTGDLQSMRFAHRARIVDLVMAGDPTAAGAELANLIRVTAELGDLPAETWWTVLWQSMRALLDGRHADAEAMSARAWELAEPAQVPEAAEYRLIQTVFLRREQARLDELEADIDAFRARAPDSLAANTLLALRAAELDDLSEAADELRRLGSALHDLREDRDWPGLWFQLSRTAYLVRDQAIAADLYEYGQNLSGHCVVVGVAAVCVGAADLALAWLAETLGDDSEAQRWYASAETINVRADARSWLAQTRLDHARLLARRGGQDDLTMASQLAKLAASAAVQIGLRSVLADADDLLVGLTRARNPSPRVLTAPGTEAVSTVHDGVFRRHGALWEVEFGGLTAALPHAKGMADLGRLLTQPGQPIHVSELVSLQAAGVVIPSGSDEVFDARARQEIRQRLADLTVETEDAEADADLGRAERARTERAELLAALSLATGLGGRPRRLDDPAERARKTVTARIRNSINRIGAEHAPLSRHLERSVDTGLWCVYQPEQPTVWRT